MNRGLKRPKRCNPRTTARVVTGASPMNRGLKPAHRPGGPQRVEGYRSFPDE